MTGDYVITNNLMLVMVVLAVYAAAGYIIEHQDKLKLKNARKKFRHTNDEEKQQMTDDVERAYRDFVENGLIK